MDRVLNFESKEMLAESDLYGLFGKYVVIEQSSNDTVVYDENVAEKLVRLTIPVLGHDRTGEVILDIARKQTQILCNYMRDGLFLFEGRNSEAFLYDIDYGSIAEDDLLNDQVPDDCRRDMIVCAINILGSNGLDEILGLPADLEVALNDIESA